MDKFKKKLITFSLPEFQNELDEVEKHNESNKGSLFVCNAVRFYMQHKDKIEPDSAGTTMTEALLRQILQQELEKALKNLDLAEIKKVEEGEGEGILNAFDILDGEDFNQNFEKFEIEYSNKDI